MKVTLSAPLPGVAARRINLFYQIICALFLLGEISDIWQLNFKIPENGFRAVNPASTLVNTIIQLFKMILKFNYLL